MAFGYKVTNGDFLPICKFDARSGKFFKVEKVPGQQANDIELVPGTKFAIDFGTLEAGWTTFTTQGPIRHMQPYIDGQAPIAQPPDKDAEGKMIYRPAFYVKLAGNALDGVREWIGASAAVMNAMDDLYTQVSHAPEMAAGQIPIVSIPSTVAIKSGTGARSSTNYAPVFKLEGWTPRPDILGPRTVPLPVVTNGHAAPTAAPQAAPAQQAPMTPPPAQQAPATSPPAGMPF
jgi:hypothetical protein